MPRHRKTFLIKCGLIYSESKYIFSCYTIKLNTKNTTALQDKSTSTACTTYLVYMHCLCVSRWHLLFHLILGNMKYLKHGQPFHPSYRKVRCPMKWTFSSSYQFFYYPFAEEAPKSLTTSFLKHSVLFGEFPGGRVAFYKHGTPLLWE